MGRNSKLGIFDVELEEVEKQELEHTKNSNSSSNKKETKASSERLTATQALTTVLRQMEIAGFRQRTIKDYKYYFDSFVNRTKIKYVDEITNDKIYMWLDSMEVSQQTKFTRLKQLKAILSRFFNNGWLESKFWTTIRIKIDQEVKEGCAEEDIKLLLSLLDFTNFVEMRDGVAVMLMWDTGVRIRTLSLLEKRNIDFKTNTLNIDGEMLKGRKKLKIPFSEETKRYLKILINASDKIKKYYKQDNELVFVTVRGTIVINGTTNAIGKKLTKYSKQYGLKNINPHAIRRGFAKQLLKKGCNVALISKALGHSSIETTTKYLHLDVDEVADELRSYID